MNNVLEVKNLTKYYGNTLVLNNISFNLPKNEIISILGRNGAGKTTLIESIFGLNNRKHGSVKFFDYGDNVFDNNVKSKIGIQLQISELFPRQTVKEIIETFSIIKSDKQDITEILNKFKLENITDKCIKSLSVGQKQRLKVCLAFLGNPSLIVLDEPTAGIDPQIKKIIWEIINEYKSRGNTLLFTTHDMNEAYSYSDRVIIINEGLIIENDSPRNLMLKFKKDTFEETFIEITGKDLRVVD